MNIVLWFGGPRATVRRWRHVRLLPAAMLVCAACSASKQGPDGASTDAVADGRPAVGCQAVSPDGAIHSEQQDNRGLVLFQGGDFSLYAGFQPTDVIAGPCVDEVVGPCTITTCPRDGVNFGQLMGDVDAGTLTVSFGTTTLEIPSQSDPFRGIEYGLYEKAPWAAGDIVTVSATGGVVPAFSQTVTIPEVLTFSEPTEGAMVDHTKDLTIAWTGSTSKLGVSAEEFTADGGWVTLGCTLDTQGGQAVLPGAALEKLAGCGEVGLSLEAVDHQVVHAGVWTVDVIVNGDGAGRLVKLF